MKAVIKKNGEQVREIDNVCIIKYSNKYSKVGFRETVELWVNSKEPTATIEMNKETEIVLKGV